MGFQWPHSSFKLTDKLTDMLADGAARLGFSRFPDGKLILAHEKKLFHAFGSPKIVRGIPSSLLKLFSLFLTKKADESTV